MGKMLLVQCLECGKKYYVNDSVVPKDADLGVGFPNECPYCEEGTHAEMINY